MTVVNRLLNFQYRLTSPFEKVSRRNEFMNSLFIFLFVLCCV